MQANLVLRDGLEAFLVCPACHGDLSWSKEQGICAQCDREYPTVDGIPVLLLDAEALQHGEPMHHHAPAHAPGHKRGQMEFFGSAVSREFEITRPHGAPALYRWHYARKFRKGVTGLESILPGANVLSVCAGSGMDAEFLATRGAHVIASDISLGAAKRARERARRYNLPIEPIVADVEQLPFRARSIDLAYVHDGLHHLERPLRGLAEMTRVAAGAVCVTEPADALVTAVAIRLGLALEREEAGNAVARLSLPQVAKQFAKSGFQVVHAERYAMYHRHEPGRIMRLLSMPGLFTVSVATIEFANLIVGRWGNKLSINAVRAECRR